MPALRSDVNSCFIDFISAASCLTMASSVSLRGAPCAALHEAFSLVAGVGCYFSTRLTAMRSSSKLLMDV